MHIRVMHLCMHLFLYMCMYIFICVYVYTVYIVICAYADVFVCMYAHTHMYICDMYGMYVESNMLMHFSYAYVCMYLPEPYSRRHACFRMLPGIWPSSVLHWLLMLGVSCICYVESFASWFIRPDVIVCCPAASVAELSHVHAMMITGVSSTASCATTCLAMACPYLFLLLTASCANHVLNACSALLI